MTDIANPAQSKWLTHAPFMGLIVLTMMILDKPLGHTLSVVIFRHMMNMAGMLILLGLGCFGIWLIYSGLKRDDVRASLSGWLGASLIWTCWFEFMLHGAAGAFGLPYVYNEAGDPVLTGSHLILLSSMPFCFMLLFLLGINKDTRCRMFMWIRRKLRLKPGKPTPGYKRQYARIVAIETIMLFWFIYIVDLLLLHPQIIGSDSIIFPITFGLVGIWLIYLFYKLSQIRELGMAIRYALPVSMFVWLFIEMASQMHLLKEIWLHPKDYPIPLILALVYMLALIGMFGRAGSGTSKV